MSGLMDVGREWLWDAFEDAPADLSDAEVRTAVARHYEGGWAQFVRDAS